MLIVCFRHLVNALKQRLVVTETFSGQCLQRAISECTGERWKCKNISRRWVYKPQRAFGPSWLELNDWIVLTGTPGVDAMLRIIGLLRKVMIEILLLSSREWHRDCSNLNRRTDVIPSSKIVLSTAITSRGIAGISLKTCTTLNSVSVPGVCPCNRTSSSRFRMVWTFPSLGVGL